MEGAPVAERAAEAKDLSALRGVISERYADDERHDKRTLSRLLQFYLLRHDAIHLFTRINDVRVTVPGQAQAVVYAAMTSRPAVNPEELAQLQADLYRFELVFAEESGEWRVTRASWRRVEIADLGL